MSNLWEMAHARETFASRHIGLSNSDINEMVNYLGYPSLEKFIDDTVPSSIRDSSPLDIPQGVTESEALGELKKKLSTNKVFKSFIGMGYHNTLTPAPIQRNILENPGWYTQYTPYQAEISQGRLEALFNFQSLISDMTKLPVANASLLDEGSAAAEAANMAFSMKQRNTSHLFFVSDKCHPQTIKVVQTRAEPLGIEVCVESFERFDFDKKPFGMLLQYPATDGVVHDYRALIQKAHDVGCHVAVAADLLSLVMLTPPGELGADIVVGSTQRFGLPLGLGGPHAGFMSTKEEFVRKMPGRLIGLSKDAHGRPAYRLALATREQHIRREKATSNICTSQVLLAIMSAMYAIYHGPDGLRRIAGRVHALATIFDAGLKKMGYTTLSQNIFDTVTVAVSKANIESIQQRALDREMNLRQLDTDHLSVAIDETTDIKDIEKLLEVFNLTKQSLNIEEIAKQAKKLIPASLERKSSFLTQPVFNRYHSEMELQRYIKKLENRDLSLTRSMIPLGSCTMKLNAASELFPITWSEVNGIHPYAPMEQAQGSLQMFSELEKWLAAITGFDAVSLQPNSGATGELAGLLVIRKFLQATGQGHRNICLIPHSAHGTNPASAALAGMKIVEINCDKDGNIDLADLRAKAGLHKANLAAVMVTYPSTHGVFEEGIRELCHIIHEHGGQVYMDGANLQAQIGLCYAGKFGPDVCHMNLHKTFAIPHGGGGPGVGPIAVKKHLASFLPATPAVDRPASIGAIAAAPWGSASVLPISWMYIRMMGREGLSQATKTSIVSANYIRKRLDGHYPVVYKGKTGLVAHECIIDIRPIKKSCQVDETDIAKRLMDYGFHAPTVSWPVAGTVMIEPTESESKFELDRFCDAMISIRQEIKEVEEGRADVENNLLKNAPHASVLLSETWDKPYSMKRALFPDQHTEENKFWVYSSRIDNAYGDRNLVCTCL
jgi:glycine dehydrogenase